MLDWFVTHMHWVFSGIGVFFLAGLFALVRRFTKRQQPPDQSRRYDQRQSGGANSTNVQIGNIHIQDSEQKE